ncbi:MAG: SUMF1/EgtB/PvdO family nonheme iron enzyme, partial [Myxococcota bacterium]|nr:SUMF1/EgtB/PvdO family nonheme iron enzyme [Myxococcota bacterium]
YVIVTADDGTDSTSVTSGTVTVSNTAPTAPVVAIDPGDPVVGEDLVCEVTTASTDADGDTVTYTMAWTVDTVAYGGALTTTWTDDTVDGGDTLVDEVWSCTATPDDGDDDGITATDSVTITQSCSDGSIVLSSSGVDFVEICAGSFDMGCTPGQSSCGSDESPVMPVTLTRNYYVSQTEVTQGQYQALMGTNPSYFSSCGTDCPVEMVSWYMAAAYANALSAAEGLSECYACTGSGASVSCDLAVSFYACEGYRLPTEAEWEGAARCGEDLLYAGSNTLNDVAWYTSTSGGRSRLVGGRDANACGLHDMSGNVWEWVHDGYNASFYAGSGRTDPLSESGSTRSIRGGGWNTTNAHRLRSAYRTDDSPALAYDNLGFRLARTVDGDYDGDGYTLSEDCDDTDGAAALLGDSAVCAAVSCLEILDAGSA